MKIHPVPIPHLKLAKEDFFYELENHIIERQIIIESWFRTQWQQTPPMITCSVDIRNAGFKLSSVDANLFPAGFNNLNPAFLPMCIQAFQNVILTRYPKCKNILVIPENHSRNTHYYESLATLQTIIKNAGYEVRIGSWHIDEVKSIPLSNNQNLILEPAYRNADNLQLKNFVPCLILLNNDLSDGLPQQLIGLSQTIDPLPQLGWFSRSKAIHFGFYNQVCESFSNLINIDPWKISPLYLDCNKVNFLEEQSIDCLVRQAETLFKQIEVKYQQYHIPSRPFIILKPDAGTYGRGVLTLHQPEDIRRLNRKQRQNLTTGKGRQSVNHILLQEGIPTIETIGAQQAAAEPVVYMLGQYVIGGFYRLHPTRSEDESLNTPGMQFEPLAFDACCNLPDKHLAPHDSPNRFYVYSVLARLALLASCFEKRAIQ